MESDPTAQQAMNEALELQRAGRLDDAEDVYRRMLSKLPNSAVILNNLANILKDSGRIEEAVTMCREAMTLDPNNAEIQSSLCYKLLFHPNSDRAAIFNQQRQFNQRFRRDAGSKDRALDCGNSPPFPSPGTPGEGQGGGDFELRARPSQSEVTPGPSGAKPNSNRRRRIGYVSPDFYGHAECFFVVPLLQSHDRARFEVHCYSSVLRPDKATDLIRDSTEFWHDVRNLTNEQLAERIRADGIDVLVDLTMHMAENRLTMFAQKPARVQVTWLAYPGGTGLDAMDYRLTDSWIDPPGESDAFYSERSIRLPDSWICYHPLGDVAPAAPRNPGPVTFGCLNNPCKLNQATLSLFGKVLSSVKDSRLLLLAASDRQRRNIAETLGGAGIDPARIEFTGHQRRREYLRLYDRIDVCLDPLIYNGITTTCDALWMGVPAITRVGDTAPGRAGLSILSNLGLPELIAADDAQFIQIATDLAGDFSRRTHLRATLRDLIDLSPLMDARSFARNIEAAYHAM